MNEAATTHSAGTVRTGDVDTYHERRGDGPPVVFVHGAAVDWRQWAPQVEALADEYATVAYDVRGHGRTGGSERERYDVDLFADDLDALLEALEIDRPVLCGCSLGGCIAQVYAARYPEKVAGLVLADTFTPELFSLSERLQRSVLLRATVLPVRLLGYPRVERALVWLHERLSPGASGEYENVEAIRASGPLMATDEFAKVIRAVASFHGTTVDYAAIAAPTLVLYGEHEPAFLRRHQPKLGAEIPNASVTEVPGGGHASNLDAPEFVTDAIRTFLSGIAPPNAVGRGEPGAETDEASGEFGGDAGDGFRGDTGDGVGRVDGGAGDGEGEGEDAGEGER